MSPSNPGSYRDDEGSKEDDAQMVKSSTRNYNPRGLFVDFKLGLRFEDLNMFKFALVDFSTRERFEYKFIKNDKVRVRVMCLAIGCKWSILYSWCNGNKTFMVKT